VLIVIKTHHCVHLSKRSMMKLILREKETVSSCYSSFNFVLHKIRLVTGYGISHIKK